MAKRYEISDEAWELIADLFVEPRRRGRPRRDDRLMLNCVLWVLCSGAAWRDMPEHFGPWSTVYQRFRDWRNQRVFDRMLQRLHIKLNEKGLIDLQTWMIDSTAVRATRASSGAGKHILARPLRIGTLRGDEPMQVVSGRVDRPTVHFEAPPRTGLEEQLADFLDWFETSRSDASLEPLLRAGIAHFWFVTLPPFNDGNGRLTRTLTDLALAQGEQQAIRFYAMSASILDDRAGYYHILEASQKGTLDITAWLQWFLGTLLKSLEQALARIDRLLAKARFWQTHRSQVLSAEQIKVLNRLLDGGDRGFEDGISAAQYQAVAKVSKATATRHLGDLLEKGCLVRLPGGGRSTRYQANCVANGQIGNTPRPPK